MNKVKNSVNDYLTNKKGYNKNEYSLNVSYVPLNYLLNSSPYNIEVIFNDEPNVTYDYRYYKNGEVIQWSAGDKTKSNHQNFKH
jgi:hypothetical protein